MRPKRVFAGECVCGQIISTSSIYLLYSIGCLECFERNFLFNSAMYMVANAGANLVPLAMPHLWVKVGLSNLNTSFLAHSLEGLRGIL